MRCRERLSYRFLAVIAAVVLLTAPEGRARAAELSYEHLQDLMLDAQRFVYERAVHPHTKQIYQRVNLDDPNLWKNTLFPDRKLVDGIMAADRYTPNVSNAAISGGKFLGALVDSYIVTGREELREHARTVFQGLERLAEVSPRRGFIARSTLPVDDTTHHLNSSVDQYTHYVYGLWRYYHSSLAGPQERASMERIMHDICTMLEADGTILASDGSPGRVSDIEVIRSDRSSRYLQMFRIGFDITGNARWEAIYHEKLSFLAFARLQSLLDEKRARHPYAPRDTDLPPQSITGSPDQTQYSLAALFELETDLTVKATYLQAMRMHALIFQNLAGYRGISGLHVIALVYNRHLAGAVDNPLDEAHRRWLSEQIRTTVARDPRSIGALEAYWTAMRRGVIRPEDH